MDRNQPLRSDVLEAWNRLLNHTCTGKDVALISEALKNDSSLPEFDEVFERVRNEALANKPPLTDEQQEAYREEAFQLIAAFERKQKAPASPIIVRFRKIRYAAAAVLLLGLLIPAAYLFLKPKTEALIVEKVTQQGEIMTFFLPDRTEVTLNVSSRIKYPENFTGDERIVELYGEALFHATTDPERPFVVKSENMNVKVLGTVFNVKAYKDDLSSSVSVASGKVEVGFDDSKVLLEKDQQAKWNKETGKVEKQNIDAEKFISWTNGIMYFERTPIHDVIHILNRNYPQVTIELAKGEYTDILITGEYNKALHPDNIIRRIVTTTNLQCEKEGNKYTFHH